jgi:hypothetical protein
VHNLGDWTSVDDTSSAFRASCMGLLSGAKATAFRIDATAYDVVQQCLDDDSWTCLPT